MAPRTRTRATPAVRQEAVTKKVYIKRFSSKTPIEDREIEELEVLAFETEPAYVRVNAGVTKNLGDYESLRVDVAITVPCYVDMVDDTFAEAAEWVAARLDQEVQTYMGEE